MGSSVYESTDHGYISWDQGVDNGEKEEGRNMCQGKLKVSWKGATWSLLCRRHASDGFDVFVCCDSIEDENPDWCCHFSFTFSLVSNSGKIKHSVSRDGNHEFHRADIPSDRGFVRCFESDEVSTHSCPSGSFIIRCELQLLPPGVPRSHLLGLTEAKLTTGMVGLDNLGATCYLNALLQMLFHINSFRKEVYNLSHKNEDMETSTTLALQNVFYKIQKDTKSVSTIGLTKSFGWNTADAFQQQDVQEMMRVLIDKLEECMKCTKRENALKNLFCGSVKSYIKCLNIDYVSDRIEDFYDIQLDVHGNKNIMESFDKYVEKEILNGENQYDAGLGRGKQDAEKGVIFTKFPPVLTIHLKRFAFDMQKMGFTKIHDRFEYPVVLDLKQYLSGGDVEVSNENSHIYRLHSVLVHSGEVYGGHYYAYIRAMPPVEFPGSSSSWLGELPGAENIEESKLRWRQRRGKWFKFDDERVSFVNENEAVEGCFGRDTNVDYARNTSRTEYLGSLSSAYMLVYIRENEATEIMKAVDTEDIPSSLKKHLSAEEVKLQFHQKLSFLLNNRLAIPYVTSFDAEMLSMYSFDADFVKVGETSRRVLLTEGSTVLSIWFSIARDLKISPDSFRLWILQPRCKKGPLRPATAITISDLSDILGERESISAVYVELLPESEMRSDREEVRKQNSEIELVEEEFVDMVVEKLRSWFSVDSATEGFVRKFTGIGMDNSLIDILSDDGKSELKKQGESVIQQSLKLMSTFPGIFSNVIESNNFHQKAEDSTPYLIIFKMYDPFHLLSKYAPNKTLSGECSESVSNDSAMVFLGTKVLHSSTSARTLIEISKSFLDSISNNCRVSLPEWNEFTINQVVTPREVKELFASTDDSDSSLREFGLNCGDIICLQASEIENCVNMNQRALVMENSIYERVVNGIITCPVPVEHLSNCKEWLYFKSHVLNVTLTPYDDIDAKIVNKIAGAWNYVGDITSGSFEKPPLAEISFEACTLFTGKQLLSLAADILGCGSYKYIAICPYKSDQRRIKIPITEKDLELPVSRILKDRMLNQNVKCMSFCVLPFDDILFDHEDASEKNSVDSYNDVPACDSSISRTQSSAKGAQCENKDHQSQSILCDERTINGNFSPSRSDDEAFVKRYPEVLLFDSRMQNLRARFIRNTLLNISSISKRRKFDIDKGGKGFFHPEVSPQCDSSSFLSFPKGVDILHAGYVEEDRIYLKVCYDECFALVSSMAHQLKQNLCPGMESGFESSTSIIRCNAEPGSLLKRSGDERLPLTPREIFLELFPDDKFHVGITGLAEKRKTEIADKWYLQSRRGVPVSIDFFSENTPSIMELACDGSSQYLDSREPLILLFTTHKRRVKTLLQHYTPLMDNVTWLPRSRIDCLCETSGDNPVGPSPLTICAQYVTREDEFWMRGLSPLMQSIAISVFCCHRNSIGGLVSVPGPVFPCLSFVVESDSTESLLKRVLAVGCSENQSDELLAKLLQYDLFAIHGDRHTTIRSNISTVEKDELSRPPWDVFAQFNRNYDSNVEWRSESNLRPLVELAILLPESSSDSTRKRSYLSSGGIKIR